MNTHLSFHHVELLKPCPEQTRASQEAGSCVLLSCLLCAVRCVGCEAGAPRVALSRQGQRVHGDGMEVFM